MNDTDAEIDALLADVDCLRSRLNDYSKCCSENATLKCMFFCLYYNLYVAASELASTQSTQSTRSTRSTQSTQSTHPISRGLQLLLVLYTAAVIC